MTHIRRVVWSIVERTAGEATERNGVGVGAVIYARIAEDHERAASAASAPPTP